MNKIELLAPAGSLESLYAAVQMGADAVYLGGSKFSARAYASNFDEETMEKAVNYCHLYNVKVYVTVNTLLKENEMEEAVEYIRVLYNLGVDAIIMQDLGLAYLTRTYFPDFEIHASTQMTVHNGEGALLLKEKGFQRIVLSRELSLKETEYISKDLNVETEIFVHGALCICYSGQCLLSSMIGGRSGNRGRCAQPCRLPYTLVEKNSKKEKSAYILSPKDMCTLENVKEMIKSGTSSLKIEGRMKRPEYVAGVVDSYRKAIDSVYEGTDFNFEQENKKLLQLFNREGFSKAYLFGNVGKSMMAYSFPKNTGVGIGRAEKDLSIALTEPIACKDGIRVGEDGFIISKITKEGREVDEAFQGEKVKLFPNKYRGGELLFKTSDTRLLNSLQYAYMKSYERKRELPLEITFKVGEPLALSSEYEEKLFTVKGEIVQSALRKPLDIEKVITNLSKAGETPFKFAKIKVASFEEGFLPLSSINEARRQIISEIEIYIKEKQGRIKKEKGYIEDCKKETCTTATVEGKHCNVEKKGALQSTTGNSIVVISTLEQLKAAQDSGISKIAIPMFSRKNEISIKECKAEELYLKVPNIIKEEFEFVCKKIEENLSIVKGILTSNLGILHRFKGKTKIIGDYKLNTFNPYAFLFYENAIDEHTLSVELNKKEISPLLQNKAITCMPLIYGKVEVMVSEYCPIGCTFGGKEGEKNCNRACEAGRYSLIDRKEEEFPVKTDLFCRSYLYNGKAINLIPNLEEMKKMGITHWRLDFIDESYEETMEVLTSFKEGKWDKPFEKYTRGHFKRGVE